MDDKATQPTRAENALQSTDIPMNQSLGEIQAASPNAGLAVETQPKAETKEIENAGGWEADNIIYGLEKELENLGYKRGFLDLEFNNPKHFTWLLVAFASMGGLLSGLDQSLISGANLALPKDLGLDDRQNSLVNAGMPLGGMWLDFKLASPERQC